MECCICFHSIDYELFECRHPCCKKCWKKWRVENPSCPVCRAQIEPIDDVTVFSRELIIFPLEEPPDIFLQLFFNIVSIIGMFGILYVMLSLDYHRKDLALYTINVAIRVEEILDDLSSFLVVGFNDFIRFGVIVTRFVQSLLNT